MCSYRSILSKYAPNLIHGKRDGKCCFLLIDNLFPQVQHIHSLQRGPDLLPQAPFALGPTGLPILDSPRDYSGRVLGWHDRPDFMALGVLDRSCQVPRLWLHGLGLHSAQPSRLLALPSGGHRRRGWWGTWGWGIPG